MVSVTQAKCPSEDNKSHSCTLNEIITALLETYSAWQTERKLDKIDSYMLLAIGIPKQTETQNIHANHNFIKTKLNPNKSRMKHFQTEKGNCSEFRSLKCE